jgi:large subunit ribosomal protein L7A
MGFEELRLVRKAVGMRATERAIQRGEAKKVYLAMDVDRKIREKIETLAKEKGIEIEWVFSAKELGRACGIEVASSCVAVLDS